MVFVAKKKARKITRKITNRKKITTNQLLNKKFKSLEKQSKNKAKYIFLTLLILVIVTALVYYLYITYTKEAKVCDSLDCFLESASACEPAVYVTKIATATIELKIDPGCTLIKKILRLDKTEPPEITAYFTGKEMTCFYDKGSFNQALATKLSGPLDECTGTLVDAIKAIV